MLKHIKWIILISVVILGFILKNMDLVSFAQEHMDQNTKEYFFDKLSKKERELIELDLDCRKKIKDYSESANSAYDILRQNRREYNNLLEIFTNQKKELDNYKNVLVIAVVAGVVIGILLKSFFK